MQQDVIMVLKFPSNSPVTHVAANTLPHLTIPAVVTVTCSRLFAVNRWHNTVGVYYFADNSPQTVELFLFYLEFHSRSVSFPSWVATAAPRRRV